MARLVYSATVSADGYIAGPGGDMSWLLDHLGPSPMAEELMSRTGALLVGARTFYGDDPHRGDPDREGAFEGQWDGPQIVLTRRTPPHTAGSVQFLDDLPTAVAAARSAAGDRDVNILGADIARQCLDLKVLDEVVIFVVPVLLGAGTRLLDRAGESTLLERIEISVDTQAVGMRHLVRYG